MDEETKTEDTETKTEENNDEGHKPSSSPLIDDAHSAAKRLEEATKAQKEENDRTEKLQHNAILSSSAGIHVPKKPIPLTDTEYAEALEKGEVNPLKEDGLL